MTSLLLVSCAPESAAPQGMQIECATGDATKFDNVCTLEPGGRAGEFVLHHPDGGFRRISYDPARGELGVLGGADSLVMSGSSTQENAEFAIGPDRYRIPSRALRGIGR